jgi:hypothetical protein
MFCSLSLGVLDTLFWSFEIIFMVNLFEVEGYFNFEEVGKIADGRMGAVFRRPGGRSRVPYALRSNQRDLAQVDEGIVPRQDSGLTCASVQVHYGRGIWFSV